MFTSEAGLGVLTEEQLDAVHDRAMTVLEEIGTDVRQPEALELLRRWARRSTESASTGIASS